MTDKDQRAEVATSPEGGSEDEELRRRLVARIAIAGVAIVALLGGLVVIDAIYAPSAPAPQVASLSPPPELAKVEPPPAEEAPAAEQAEPEKEAEAAQESSAAPSSSAHPVPDDLKPLTKPAEAKQAMLKPSAPLAALPRPQPMQDLGQRRLQPAPLATMRHAPPSRPLSQPQESLRRFVVQMGVFNNLANAEELRAKLELNGIPAQIEARVQVGPFNSRQEADEARRKLVALGIEPGLLMAIRK